MAGKLTLKLWLGFCFREKKILVFTYGGTMDRNYFLTRYEIDCLDRTLEELILLYPLVPLAQIRADMAEILENCPEMRNLD